MAEHLTRLRELSHDARAGTWFTCELAFSPGSRGYTCRTDSSAPPFEHVPAAAALAELTAFPCEEPPGWLPAALPTAPPLPLPVTYGDRYDRYPGPFDDPVPRPPLPVTGEVSYRPDATLTARRFDHDRQRDRRLLVLVERDGDPEAAHLLVTSSETGYWVSRGALRGAGEGLRSISLDGGVLRLELTPEAADALETETAFEVRLDLAEEAIGELRVVLPEMLRQVPEAPRLIGVAQP